MIIDKTGNDVKKPIEYKTGNDLLIYVTLYILMMSENVIITENN